jgi:hypothetical protein
MGNEQMKQVCDRCRASLRGAEYQILSMFNLDVV